MKNKGIYRVVVVEDEPKILRNIVQKIEKANPAFVVEATASNGKDAIPVIDSVKPHVLFTDIKMPVMNGLELINHVKSYHPHMQIIILTGYGEFKYAQQAIKLGVKDYLLKPVEEVSIHETLSGVEARLNAAISSAERDILYSDINGQSHNSPLPYLFEDSHYIMLLVCIGNLCNHLPATSLYKFYRELWDSASVGEVLKNDLGMNCKLWIVDEKQPNQKFIIISSRNLTGSDIRPLAEKLLNALLEIITSNSVTVCISEQVITYRELSDFAQILRKTMDNGLIIGRSSVITPNTIKVPAQSSALVDAPTLNRFTVLIQSNNRNLLFQELEGLLYRWNQLQYPQRILEKGIYQLIRQCYSQTSTISEVELSHLEYELSEKLSIAKDLKGIYEDICHIFDTMLVQDGKDNDNAKELVARIEEYIKAHFTEPIGLEDISAKFSFSISYITKIFKKYKDDTILKYLITLRINEAKRLMESQKDLEVKNISEIVGYTDQHYFSRIFKNVTGMSPSEYRDSYKDKNNN